MKIYFLGIGGVAMGNLALLAKKLGHQVFGSDHALYPPMNQLLEAANIVFSESFSVENWRQFRPDLVVVGNAIARGNEEVEALLVDRTVPYTSAPEFLDRFLLKNRQRIIIAGTHGKTTTAALTTFYLRQQGVNCGYFIGGVPRDFPSGADLGDMNQPFVVEGDEYDSAFFDKRSKFIHYRPDILIINRIDFDHADIFRDLRDVQRSFRHLFRTMPSDSTLLINGDDGHIRDLFPVPWLCAHSVGFGPNNDFRIRRVKERDSRTSWEIQSAEKTLTLSSQLLGKFNVLNASTAVLAVHIRGLLPWPDRHVDLEAFQGVHRRQEWLLKTPQLLVMEDFAHHPRAVKSVLKTLQAQFPNRELVVCFEPVSNTSARKILMADFIKAFRNCDRCFLGVSRTVSIPPDERIRTDEMAKKLKPYLLEAEAFTENSRLLDHLLTLLKDGQPRLLVLFSNGAFRPILDFWRNKKWLEKN